jgi:hypothetical protein
VEASLAEKLAQPVEVLATPFSIVPENASEFAEKRVRDVEPEAVILLLGTFPFTAGFTWLRIQQLFGKRAGRWYKRIEEQFDTRTSSDAGKPSRFNLLSRTAVRRIVGTRTYTTREKSTERYRATFRVLSRFEDTRIVVMSYPGVGQHARTGKGPERRRIFIAEMQQAAKEHHFQWVDGAAVFTGVDVNEVKLDDLHFGAKGHQLLAEAVEAALVDR